MSQRRCAVDIWWIDLRRPGASDVAMLSDQERARAARFHRRGDRDRFVAAHAQVRTILSELLGVMPSAVRFDPGENGKPEVAGIADLHISVSRSRDLAGLAITCDCPTGIDVELRRELTDCLSLAEVAFSDDEVAQLRAREPDERSLAFLRLWTAKEAWVKNVGLGVEAFGAVSILLSADGSPHIADAHAPGGPWSVHRLEPGPRFVGALSVAAHEVDVTERSWPR